MELYPKRDRGCLRLPFSQPYHSTSSPSALGTNTHLKTFGCTQDGCLRELATQPRKSSGGSNQCNFCSASKVPYLQTNEYDRGPLVSNSYLCKALPGYDSCSCLLVSIVLLRNSGMYRMLVRVSGLSNSGQNRISFLCTHVTHRMFTTKEVYHNMSLS